MTKIETPMNKPAYLRLAVLELSKILMYEFGYDYIRLKYDKRSKLYYIDTDSFIAYLKRDDVYRDIAEDVETRIDTSNYELNRPLPKRKKK